MEQITGVILILISFWEFYSVRGVFLNSKRHGTKIRLIFYQQLSEVALCLV